MTDHKAGTREPRHYLSYVREELIGMWKVQAVGETVASHAQRDKKSEEWISRALRKREALRGNHAEAVWPWAFQLGRTPAAKSLKAGYTLWIVTRPSGLGQQWPPALVARMTLAEDVQRGPDRRAARRHLP
jgi:hypothetical protein